MFVLDQWAFVLDHRVFVLDQWVFVLDHRVSVLDQWVFVLDYRILGLRSSFLGLRFSNNRQWGTPIPSKTLYFNENESFSNLKPYLSTFPVFPGVSKFFIKTPGLLVSAPNLLGNTYCGLFQKF